MGETVRAFRFVLWVLAGVLGVPVGLSMIWFIHGSLEMFPTDEQQTAARIAASVSFLFFATIETAVLTILFRTRR